MTDHDFNGNESVIPSDIEYTLSRIGTIADSVDSSMTVGEIVRRAYLCGVISSSRPSPKRNRGERHGGPHRRRDPRARVPDLDFVPRRRGRGRHLRTAFEEPFSQGRRKWSVMEAMCIVFVFAALVCLGLLSPFLYAAAAVLPMAANLLRRLIRLIGGSR